MFSLGVVLFELLTGRHPFAPGAQLIPGTTAEAEGQAAQMLPAIAWRIMQDHPTFTESERTTIPSTLLSVCATCLEKSPANRPVAWDITRMLDAKLEYIPRGKMLADRLNRAMALQTLGKLEVADTLVQPRLAL